MAGRFHCESARVEGPHRFVLTGTVRDGDIAAGMTVSIPLNSQLAMRVDISAVENLPCTDKDQRLDLVIECPDDTENAVLDGLNISREELLVDDREAVQHARSTDAAGDGDGDGRDDG